MKEEEDVIPEFWWLYRGDGKQWTEAPSLPPAPKWRRFKGNPIADRLLPIDPEDERGAKYKASRTEREMVNTALFLRRPLLITGKPGSGKSTLAHSVAYELNLGPVLRWPITTRSTLQDGLYRYDAIARLHEASLRGGTPKIGPFVQLGPLGTAMVPTRWPRVLLIDEIDKSDIDLPNDLLNIFEEGEFEIPELARMRDKSPVVEILPYDGEGVIPVEHGIVRCCEFPIVLMTSNSEREFPPAFYRRCLRLTIQPPKKKKLEQIVEARLDLNDTDRESIDKFSTSRMSKFCELRRN